VDAEAPWPRSVSPPVRMFHPDGEVKMTQPAKNTICLWYDKDAEEAARFYARVFPDSSVGAVHLAPGDFPSGKKGDVLTVEFTVLGIPCLGLNGGPGVVDDWAFSLQVCTMDQRKAGWCG